MSKRPRRHGNRAIVSMLMLRQDGKCFYCGLPILIHADERYRLKATLDHKVPLAKGGEPFGDNVVAACFQCNMHKGMLDAETFIAVRNDHVRRKKLIRELQGQAQVEDQLERAKRKQQIRAAQRESLINLQIELRQVVHEYRKKLNAGVAHGDAAAT